MVEDPRVKFLQGKPKDMTTERKFRLVARLLRQNFPPDRPVKIRRSPREIMGGRDAPWGYCRLVNAQKVKSKQYFLIEINKAATCAQQIDTLMHEWAHCLTWYLVESDHRGDHGDLFHRMYGNIYRFLIED